ncbi:hypothetical protein EDD80_11348 [Anseongella ginsenosidimutans]|uniref:Uncharacterized protein n=1 Tax=Anseongella ginsenosidimutans TaxID=496056 RepID=A0A4R3KM56_9SPHI|nr:hypothetical protein [Anseongella ginsenosidimutans]QEC52508.1 hypothetical protein FRZ59_09280 [Anseongella ginsenosidimutans]TCS85311.1 hypothetical protein EDD80_11348 [Anseongella ginsenosidimutans]
MSITKIKKNGTEQFQRYLSHFKDQAKREESNNFYHVDVVADAYNQGFCDGEQSGRKEFVEELVKGSTERFVQKATQVYILTNLAVDHIQKNQYHVHSFFINIVHPNPQVIIVVPNEQLLDDKFVKETYEKMFELKKIFCKLFGDTFDIGLMGAEGIDLDALKEDRFDYSESFMANE